MKDQVVKKIVIVGGGSAGWMAAASLANSLRDEACEICLVESEEIPPTGVGEATLPTIRGFNSTLGIDEHHFIESTEATFKLGINFENWRLQGHSFFHPFASYGKPLGGVDFHQYWLKGMIENIDYPLSDYCLATNMAKQMKFAQPRAELPDFAYAFHFDANKYARYLQNYAMTLGVVRLEAKVVGASINHEQFIESVELELNGANNKELEIARVAGFSINEGNLDGDLFVDCSGFMGLLISRLDGADFEDWSSWLPCNKAIAIKTIDKQALRPFTRSIAKDAGWQWNIPLQNRNGNGYVYCDDYISQDQATDELLQGLEGAPIEDPKYFSFTAGMRSNFWVNNCVALGLSGGFLEPLESTSLALIQSGLSKLHTFFPNSAWNKADIKEANRQNKEEVESIRDFLILHYKLTQRDDTQFWTDRKNMPIPDTLQHKIDVYKSRGLLVKYFDESFEDASWLSIFHGMGVYPTNYDFRVNRLTNDNLEKHLAKIRTDISSVLPRVPLHDDFIKQNFQSSKPQLNH